MIKNCCSLLPRRSRDNQKVRDILREEKLKKKYMQVLAGMCIFPRLRMKNTVWGRRPFKERVVRKLEI